MPKVSLEYKEERRAALMASALQCFAEKGYQATTVDDIVRHADASKGAVYHYFKGKEEIFLALLDDMTEQSISFLRTKFENLSTATEKLRYLFRLFSTTPLNEERHNRLYLHLEFWLYASRQLEVKYLLDQRIDKLHLFFADIVEEGKASGEFRQDIDAMMAAKMFWAYRDGVGLNFLHVEKEEEHARIWQETERLFFSYLI